MRYFELHEIILGVIAILLLGIISGAFWKSLYSAVLNIPNFIKCLPVAYRNADFKRIKIIKNDVKYVAETKSKVLIFALDFLFTMIFFINFIVFTYVFLDGLFRMYAFFLLCISFWISQKLVGIFLNNLTEKSFQMVLSLFTKTVAFFLIPLNRLTYFLVKISNLILRPINFRIQSLRSKKIFDEKCKKTLLLYIKQ